jgi:hypothetical protein
VQAANAAVGSLPSGGSDGIVFCSCFVLGTSSALPPLLPAIDLATLLSLLHYLGEVLLVNFFILDVAAIKGYEPKRIGRITLGEAKG